MAKKTGLLILKIHLSEKSLFAISAELLRDDWIGDRARVRRVVGIEQPHGTLVTVTVTAAHILQHDRLRGFRGGVILRLSLPWQNSPRVPAKSVVGPTSLSVLASLLFDLSKSPRLMCYFYFDFASNHNLIDIASQVRPEDGKRSHDCSEVDL